MVKPVSLQLSRARGRVSMYFENSGSLLRVSSSVTGATLIRLTICRLKQRGCSLLSLRQRCATYLRNVTEPDKFRNLAWLLHAGQNQWQNQCSTSLCMLSLVEKNTLCLSRVSSQHADCLECNRHTMHANFGCQEKLSMRHPTDYWSKEQSMLAQYMHMSGKLHVAAFARMAATQKVKPCITPEGIPPYNHDMTR